MLILYQCNTYIHITYNYIDTYIHQHIHTQTIHIQYMYTVHTYTYIVYTNTHMIYAYPCSYSLQCPHVCIVDSTPLYMDMLIQSIQYMPLPYMLPFIYRPLLYTHVVYAPPICYPLYYIPLLYAIPFICTLVIYTTLYSTHVYKYTTIQTQDNNTPLYCAGLYIYSYIISRAITERPHTSIYPRNTLIVQFPLYICYALTCPYITLYMGLIYTHLYIPLICTPSYNPLISSYRAINK